MVWLYKFDQKFMRLQQQLEAIGNLAEESARISELYALECDWQSVLKTKDLRKQQKITPQQVLHIMTQISETTLHSEAEPTNRQDLYFLFKWLFQEVLINLNLMRNNELVKFLNYQILKKNPTLLEYIKYKIRNTKKQQTGKLPSESQINSLSETEANESDTFSQIEKAIQVLQDDQYVNYEVLLAEQMKEFYLLQPEQATLSEQYFFFESKEKDKIQKQMQSQRDEEEYKSEVSFGGEHSQSKSQQQSKQINTNPFKVRQISPNEEILPKQEEAKKQKLKMNIPKGILKGSSGNQQLGKHVNFDSHTDSVDQMAENAAQKQSPQSDTLLSSLGESSDYHTHQPDDAFNKRLQETLSKSNSHSQVSKVLQKFLKGDWEMDHEGEDFLVDKMLTEFPIFSLNEDYMRAIVNIIYMKIDQVQNVLRQKGEFVKQTVQGKDNSIGVMGRETRQGQPNTIKQRKQRTDQRFQDRESIQQRENQLRTVKQKLQSRSNSRSLDPSFTREQLIKPTNGEQINHWISKQQRKQQVQQATQILVQSLRPLVLSDMGLALSKIIKFSNDLLEKHLKIKQKVERKKRAKLFYLWFDAYFNQVDKYHKIYTDSLKRKVVLLLRINRSQVILRQSKAMQFYQQNLKIQAFYALLKNVNQQTLEANELSHQEPRQQLTNRSLESLPSLKDSNRESILRNPQIIKNDLKQKQQTKLVEIVPVIDRDISSAFRNNHSDYMRELSPQTLPITNSLQRAINNDEQENQIETNMGSTFNVFATQKSFEKQAFQLQGRGGLGETKQAESHYSPVRFNRAENGEESGRGFQWRLVQNSQNKENSSVQINHILAKGNQDIQQELIGYDISSNNERSKGNFYFNPDQAQESNPKQFKYISIRNTSSAKPTSQDRSHSSQKRFVKPAISPYFQSQVDFFMGSNKKGKNKLNTNNSSKKGILKNPTVQTSQSKSKSSLSNLNLPSAHSIYTSKSNLPSRDPPAEKPILASSEDKQILRSLQRTKLHLPKSSANGSLIDSCKNKNERTKSNSSRSNSVSRNERQKTIQTLNALEYPVVEGKIRTPHYQVSTKAFLAKQNQF